MGDKPLHTLITRFSYIQPDRKAYKAVFQSLTEHGAQIDIRNAACDRPLRGRVKVGCVLRKPMLAAHLQKFMSEGDEDESGPSS